MIPRLGLTHDISFLVDTGAQTTVLMPADAERMELPFHELDTPIKNLGVGGEGEAFEEPAMVAFDDGAAFKIFQIRLSITAPEPVLMAAPSLLGRDVLNRWSIAYDAPAKRLEAEVVSADMQALFR